MKELLEKLSSYNIFNYLLPGILFSVIVSEITDIDILQFNIIIGVFVYYFIGLIISRIGSLIIEPILKGIKFVKFADYKDFIKVSKQDEKIEVLSESNNMYRTFISMFLLIVLVKIYSEIVQKWTFIGNYNYWILIFILLIMFLFSYKKQTKYITSRIDSQKDKI